MTLNNVFYCKTSLKHKIRISRSKVTAIILFAFHLDKDTIFITASYLNSKFWQQYYLMKLIFPIPCAFFSDFNLISSFCSLLLPFFSVGHCIKAVTSPLLRNGFWASNILPFWIDMMPEIFVMTHSFVWIESIRGHFWWHFWWNLFSPVKPILVLILPGTSLPSQIQIWYNCASELFLLDGCILLLSWKIYFSINVLLTPAVFINGENLILADFSTEVAAKLLQ